MVRIRHAACAVIAVLSFLALKSLTNAAYIDEMGCCRHGQPLQLVVGSSLVGCDAGTEPTQFEGDICQIITVQGVDGDGHSVADLEVVHFDMIGFHPVFGTMMIELDTSRPVPPSTLRSVRPGADFPVVHTTFINITATAENFPGIVLQNAGPPLEFTGDPSDTWPPTENVYTLPVPVPFEDRDNPGAILITVCPAASVSRGTRSASLFAGT